MSVHDDLPLFKWRPPECKILAFPSVRRVGKIRQTATTLINASTDKQLARFRSQIFDAIENGLLRLGVDAETARRERALFVDAVEAEMRRRVFGGAAVRPDGGGAA